MSRTIGQGGDSVIMAAAFNFGVSSAAQSSQPESDLDTVGLQLVTDGTLHGTWSIQVDNTYTPAGSSSSMGQEPGVAGTWPDATALFTSIAAVSTSGSNQYTQCAQLSARAFRVTFTPTAGIGNAFVYLHGKQWS